MVLVHTTDNDCPSRLTNQQQGKSSDFCTGNASDYTVLKPQGGFRNAHHGSSGLHLPELHLPVSSQGIQVHSFVAEHQAQRLA